MCTEVAAVAVAHSQYPLAGNPSAVAECIDYWKTYHQSHSLSADRDSARNSQVQVIVKQRRLVRLILIPLSSCFFLL
jgi:hypothetical protein